LITFEDSKVMDLNSAIFGVNIKTLMTNAGKAIAEILDKDYPAIKIAFACGKGNNGGDGFAAAHFIRNHNVTVLLIDSKTSQSEEASYYYSLLKCPIMPFEMADLDSYDLIVDCGLGTGIHGNIKEPYISYVKKLNKFKGIIISVDLPTGFDTINTVKPARTITLHDIKEGMNETNCGEIVTIDIGVPPEAYKYVGTGDMIRYPIPAPNSHKGCNGSLLIIGGGPYYGAPAMSALAAMRIGTDLVKIVTPSKSYERISSFSPVFVMGELSGDRLKPEHVKNLLDLCNMYNAVLIGPGLGLEDETSEAVKEFVSKCPVPMVIDADGITSLGREFRFKDVPSIITPHSREFIRIGGTFKDDTERSVNIKSLDINSIIVLKGQQDYISDGYKTRINTSGTVGMTSAGTGDVLGGIIAGLLSKGMKPFDAACLGTYISGKAGELAFEEKSYGMIATDVIDKIPIVLKNELR
jgi:hydroxyethylthiazole kinase-like uncharacterized protein yjeF